MEEPFWLGLMAVLIVLGILGLGYTLKKHLHFEKFDRLLTDGNNGGSGGEGGKNRQGKTSRSTTGKNYFVPD